jgi:nanoRNase/pAp phosphatase (c-di-AMP/oligoRNAs hydrolase)
MEQVELSPTVGLVNTIVGNTNQIVHQLLEQQATPFPVLITLFRRGNGMILASLRSRNGEALKVAEKLQGGGHANASGTTLPRSIQNIPDAIVYLRQVLNPGRAKGSPLNNLESLFDAIELAKK